MRFDRADAAENKDASSYVSAAGQLWRSVIVRNLSTLPMLPSLTRTQVMVNTEAIIKHAIQEKVKITLVVNKIDRLVLELRIKPADAFLKIKHTIEEVNMAIRSVSGLCWLFLRA